MEPYPPSSRPFSFLAESVCSSEYDCFRLPTKIFEVHRQRRGILTPEQEPNSFQKTMLHRPIRCIGGIK